MGGVGRGEAGGSNEVLWVGIWWVGGLPLVWKMVGQKRVEVIGRWCPTRSISVSHLSSVGVGGWVDEKVDVWRRVDGWVG